MQPELGYSVLCPMPWEMHSTKESISSGLTFVHNVGIGRLEFVI